MLRGLIEHYRRFYSLSLAGLGFKSSRKYPVSLSQTKSSCMIQRAWQKRAAWQPTNSTELVPLMFSSTRQRGAASENGLSQEPGRQGLSWPNQPRPKHLRHISVHRTHRSSMLSIGCFDQVPSRRDACCLGEAVSCCCFASSFFFLLQAPHQPLTGHLERFQVLQEHPGYVPAAVNPTCFQWKGLTYRWRK